MLKILRTVVFNRKTLPIITLLAIGVFLRLYRFSDFVTFLGDQGRDVIILKRILTLEHLPAIGPPTSVGQVYLGPFYYYFIAPWLGLFGFDPIGPAYGVAFFSLAYILVTYLIAQEFFNEKVALVSAGLLTFSYVLVDFSRFSWNPNLLPLFSLLTLYFLIKTNKTKGWVYFFLFGAFLSFSIQLHYLALFLVPASFFFLVLEFISQRREWKSIVRGIAISAGSFILFSLPLLIFDLRHNFLNTNNFIHLFNTSQNTQNRLTGIFNTFLTFNKYVFNSNFTPLLSSLLLVLIIGAFLILLKKQNPIKFFLLFFIIVLLGLSIYSGPKYPHYFGTIISFYYILIAYFLALLYEAKLGQIAVIAFLILYIFLQGQNYYFLKNKANNQIQIAKDVAKVILNNAHVNKFTLTALPERYSDSTFRYFLEIWGKKPIEKDSLVKADELFVVCEGKCDLIIGNPQWDIAYFAPRKITLTRTIHNVTIYRLIR